MATGTPSSDAAVAAGTTVRDDTGRPYVVVEPAPRFPDVLAEITRAQPLTMLSVAFVAGMVLAAGWRR